MFDTEEEDFGIAWLLAIASDKYYWMHCLVIVPADKPNEYRRVGLCHVDILRTRKFFDDAKEETIALVRE